MNVSNMEQLGYAVCGVKEPEVWDSPLNKDITPISCCVIFMQTYCDRLKKGFCWLLIQVLITYFYADKQFRMFGYLWLAYLIIVWYIFGCQKISALKEAIQTPL